MSPTSAGVPDLRVLVPDVLARRASDAPRAWTESGTFVLVDLSGFTALSERLAIRGPEGTEALITTVSEVFTALLQASADGGDVWKFAGDALLVAYQGSDHERRACHAVAAMRGALARVGRRRLAGVRAELRLSAGVHTGTARLLLTGSEQLNLVVYGEAIDALLALQTQASPGQILLGAATAAAVPSGWLADDPGSAVGTGASALGEPEHVPPYRSPEAPGGDVRPYLPRCFVQRPDLLTTEADHRRAAMAFLQVHGLDPDDPGAVESLTQAVEHACALTGVTLLDTDPAAAGFRYFLTAGAPVALENAEGRLLTALLEMLRTPTALKLRAGLSSGQVFAGLVGSPTRRTYTAMGDPTNLAARLTARAPDGAVLVTREALERVRSDLDSEPHPAVALKGKEAPVQVVIVRGARGVTERSGSQDPGTPLLGRADEIDQVGRVLRAAAHGRGGVAEIVGDAGIGKSRLADVVVHAHECPARTVTLDAFGAEVPFRAVSLVVRAVLGLTGSPREASRQVRDLVTDRVPDLLPWLSLITDLLGAEAAPDEAGGQLRDLDRRFRAARTAEVLREFLAAILVTPTTLVIEDSHWADPASVEILRHLLRALHDLPLAVVLTRRPISGGLDGDRSATTVLLGPLDPEAALALARRGLGRPVHPRDLEALVQRAGGNPLFLLELVRVWEKPGETLPASVEEVVASRVDLLRARDRDLLRRLAVGGLRVPGPVVAAVTGGDADLGPLADFVDRSDDGTVAFRREVYRDVAYAQLSFRRRRTLHGQIAAALEVADRSADVARAALLSLHHLRAGDWDAAARWSRRAALEAAQRDAAEEAAVFWDRALTAGRRAAWTPADVRAAYVGRAEALFVCGRYPEAADAYARALRGLDDPLERTRLTYELGMVRREEGRFDAALRCARRARATLRKLTGEDAVTWSAEIDLLEAGVRYWQGRSGDCLRLARRAADRAQALPASVRRTRLLARAYALHDTAAVELDGVQGEYGDLPLEMFEEIGDRYHLTRFAVNVGYGLFYAGDWEGALARWRRSLEVATRIGDLSNLAVNEMNIGELLGHQGHLDEARPLLSRSLDTLVGLHTELAAAHAALFLGVVERLAGDLAAAEESFRRAEELFVAAGRTSGFSIDDLDTRRLELRADQGRSAEPRPETARLQQARTEAEHLLVRPGLAAVHRLRVLLVLSAVLNGLGDQAGAQDAARQALLLAEGDVAPFDRALAWEQLGSPEQRVEARRILRSLDVVRAQEPGEATTEG